MNRYSNCFRVAGILGILFLQVGCVRSMPNQLAGHTLRYASDSGKILHYQLTSESLFKIVLPDIATDLNRKTVFKNDYSFTVSQDDKDRLQLAVTVNNMRSNTFHVVNTPQGHFRTGKAIDFSDVNGKMFHVTATNLGEELAYDGMDKLKAFNRKPSELDVPIDIERFFTNVLFDLPENAIHAGDEWKVEKTATFMNEEGLEQTATYVTRFTFERLEIISDRQCLKILTNTKGTVAGASTGNSDHKGFEGAFEESGIMYLDAEDAVIIKFSNASTTTGKATLFTAIGYLTEPFTTTRTVEMALVE